MVRSIVNLAIMLVVSFSLTGCLESMVEPQAQVDTSLQQQSFSCPGKAKVAVARFDWRAGGGGSTTISGPGGTTTISHEAGVATGLRDMFVTGMVQSKCFRVLERQDFGALAEEMSLRESGYSGKEEEGTRKGKVKEADLMIVGAITGWEPGSSGIKGGVGGLAGGVLAGIGGALSKASMAMDVRIIDVETSEVLAATRVEGTSKSISAGGVLGGVLGTTPLGGGLGVYAKTPMEKAIRASMTQALKFVIDNIPPEYYH